MNEPIVCIHCRDLGSRDFDDFEASGPTLIFGRRFAGLRDRFAGDSAHILDPATFNWELKGQQFTILSQNNFHAIFDELIKRGVRPHQIRKPPGPIRLIKVGPNVYEMREEFLTIPGEFLSKKVSAENLRDFTRLLDEHGITYFLIFGTLLGALRERDFIKHDIDTDVGVYGEDLDALMSLVFVLDAAGLRLVRWQSDLLTFMRGGDHIDVHPFRCRRFPFRGWRSGGYIIGYEFLADLTLTKMGSETYRIPQFAEELLARTYGKDWMKPIEEHHATRNRLINRMVRRSPGPLRKLAERFVRRIRSRYGLPPI